jgi:hypothetical protein
MTGRVRTHVRRGESAAQLQLLQLLKCTFEALRCSTRHNLNGAVQARYVHVCVVREHIQDGSIHPSDEVRPLPDLCTFEVQARTSNVCERVHTHCIEVHADVGALLGF